VPNTYLNNLCANCVQNFNNFQSRLGLECYGHREDLGGLGTTGAVVVHTFVSKGTGIIISGITIQGMLFIIRA
jgi:hypothetical protein